ncbi:hypothetical protein VPH35_076664 [Triticum aestivum]
MNQVRAFNHYKIAHEKASRQERRTICPSNFSGCLPPGDATTCRCCTSFPASSFLCCSRARRRRRRRRWSPTCQDSMALSPSTSKPDTWAWRRRQGRSSSTTSPSRSGAPARTPSSSSSPAGLAAQASAASPSKLVR